jgi:hypothetical protein
MTMNAILRHYDTLRQLLRLPVARLDFDTTIDPDDIRNTYRYYTRRHPRYKIIGNKTMGAALIDLGRFDMRRPISTASRARIAAPGTPSGQERAAMSAAEIDRNEHIDAIHAINTALDERQGRPMDQKYREKPPASTPGTTSLLRRVRSGRQADGLREHRPLWQFQRFFPAHRHAQQRRHHASADGRHRLAPDRTEAGALRHVRHLLRRPARPAAVQAHPRFPTLSRPYSLQ